MTVAFPFDRDFQIGILSLMTQRYDFLLLAVDVIQSNSFEDKILIWFYDRIKDHCLNHHECPSKAVLHNELIKAVSQKLIKQPEFGEYIKVYNRIDVPVQSQNYVMDEVVRFCRRQAGRKVYLETAKVMDTAGEAEWDQILERLHEARNIGVNYLDTGSWYFKEAKERCLRRAQIYSGKLCSTGIQGLNESLGQVVSLDDLMGGGLQEGQLGMWLGGTGRGKSIALCHVGKLAVLQGKKVVHYTLELKADQVAARYDSTYSGVEYRELNGNSKQVMAVVDDLCNNKNYGESLLIKYYPMRSVTVATIRNHLRQLAGRGWVPDLVLIDYLDLIKPTTTYHDLYQDLGIVAQDLCGLAGEIGVPMWTATQANRAGLSQEIIDVEHIGDSLQKAQIADVILALCLNREEKQDQEMRIFIAKNRNGPDKIELKIKTKYSHMSLYDGPASPVNPSSKQGANPNQAVPGLGLPTT